MEVCKKTKRRKEGKGGGTRKKSGRRGMEKDEEALEKCNVKRKGKKHS
jgi:hypothetical protein